MRLLAASSLVAATLFVHSTAAHAETPTLGSWMSAYNVYAGKNIVYTCSDFEGTVGAGGSAWFSRMSLGAKAGNTIVPTVATGWNFQLLDGSVSGDVEAGNQAWLDHYSVDDVRAGGVAFCSSEGSRSRCDSHSAPRVEHAVVAAEMVSLTAQIAAQPSARIEADATGALRIEAHDGVNVVAVDGAALAAAPSLTITGSAHATVFIKVEGSQVIWAERGDVVQLQGGVRASAVLFAFLDAKLVELHHINVSGTVFAPLADVNFYEGRVDGNLYAGRSLFGNPLSLPMDQTILCTEGASGGQVNRVPFSPGLQLPLREAQSQ